MIATIIILYVLNVFLNRWINSKTDVKLVPMWFLSLPCTFALIIIYFCENDFEFDNKLYNWFVGKHW